MTVPAADRATHPLSGTARSYLAAMVVERGLSSNTAAAYRRDLDQYLGFLADRGIQSPDAAAVTAYAQHLHDRRLAPASVARKIAAVRGLHRYAVAEALAEDDPTVLVASPKRPLALPKALTIEEVARLVEAPDPSTDLGCRDRAMLEFMYATGARVSETVGVDLLDLDLDDGVALVTGKGAKQRLVPLGRHAIDAIRSYLPVRLRLERSGSSSPRLFLSRRGRPLSRQAVWQIVRKHAVEAGLDPNRVSPHVLRHSAATHLVEGGADLRTVQDILGHASISTTQVYTRVSPRHLYEVFVSSHPRSR